VHHFDDPDYHRALAAVPDGACTMLVHWTRVDVRVPETGEYRTLEWSELDPHRDAALVGLMMRQLDNGMTDLRALPEYFYRHPDQCPACEEAALPGPTVHGVWLDEAWHREFVVAGIQGTGERVQRFANRDFAETIAQKRLTALLQHRRSRKPLDPQLGDLARLPDRPPITPPCLSAKPLSCGYGPTTPVAAPAGPTKR
jgi:hypothetical protein